MTAASLQDQSQPSPATQEYEDTSLLQVRPSRALAVQQAREALTAPPFDCSALPFKSLPPRLSLAAAGASNHRHVCTQDLQQQKDELLNKVHVLKTELQDWRVKLDVQVKTYKAVSPAQGGCRVAAAVATSKRAWQRVPPLFPSL